MSVQVWNKNPNYDPTDPTSLPGEAVPISGRVSSSINNLKNVSINNPSDGQGLIYNETTEKWENQDVVDNSILTTMENITEANTSEWSVGSYPTNTYKIKDNHLYCSKQETSSDWVASEWEEINMTSLKDDLNSLKESFTNNLIVENVELLNQDMIMSGNQFDITKSGYTPIAVSYCMTNIASVGIIGTRILLSGGEYTLDVRCSGNGAVTLRYGILYLKN